MRIFSKKIRRFFPVYLLFSLAVILFAGLLLAFNIWLEYYGVPVCVMTGLSNRLKQYGVEFCASSCKAGILKGIVFENIDIKGKNSYEYPSLHAKRLQLAVSPWRIFEGALLPMRVKIGDGRLNLPLLPEFGKEGEADLLSFTALNADIGGDPGMIVLHKAKGKIRNFEFSVSGTLDNLLHLAGARGSELLHDKLMEKESEKTLSPRSLNWYRRLMENIPLSMRKYIIRSLDKLSERNFEGVPKINAFLSLDAKDFNKTRAEASLFFPDVQYGYLKIGAIHEKLLLENGILQFQDLRLELGDGEYILSQGRYDSSMSSISGTFSGSCSPEKMLLFVDEAARETLADKLRLSEAKLIAFNGTLHHLSTLTGSYSGTVELRIPVMTFNGVRLKNVSTTVDIGDDLISGRIVSDDPGGNEIRSTYTITGNTFKAVVEGKTPPHALRNFLSESAAEFIYGSIKFKNRQERLHFTGEITSHNWKSSEFEGKIRLTLPTVICHGLEVNQTVAELAFTPNTLAVNNIEAKIDDSLSISGNMKCLLKDRLITASVICRGSPGKTIKMLDPQHKSFIESLTADIKWPAKGNLMETNADISISYGKNPAYFITGSLVMTDFEYRDIHFNYGATRFLIDSNKLLVLPGAILQTRDGQSLLTVSYRGASSGEEEDLAQEFISPKGILNFSIDSTMSGNDIMRCLYPEWRSEFIDFPQRMKVTASGLIDYKNEMNTRFTAEINNGTCFWNGIRITDVDTGVRYENNRLFIKNASAAVCNGRIGMDYEFDFNTKRGQIDAKLKGALLSSVLREFHIDMPNASRTNASVSAAMNAGLYYNAEDLLQMDGAGDLQIKGSDLWSVPVLGELLKILGKAWNTNNLGSITEVNGEFKLRGDELATTSLKSDGSVVALNANGVYHWNTNEFDFRVRAELLKGTLPFETLSTVLTPISWILERRIQGKLDSYKWQE